MKITTEHRKAINKKARETNEGGGGFSYVEVRRSYPCNLEHTYIGEHYNQAFYRTTDGSLIENDLGDLQRLAELKEVEDHPSGEVVLDLYVQAREEFSHNLTATFRDGALVSVEE